jgi:hypothetical protein
LGRKKEDAGLLPPIRVPGETVSLSGMAYSTTHDCEVYTGNALYSEQRTTVKWFPGVHMYKALERAAKSGMGDVIRLLVAAGNDTNFLERNLWLCKLMSKMNIS